MNEETKEHIAQIRTAASKKTTPPKPPKANPEIFDQSNNFIDNKIITTPKANIKPAQQDIENLYSKQSAQDCESFNIVDFLLQKEQKTAEVTMLPQPKVVKTEEKINVAEKVAENVKEKEAEARLLDSIEKAFSQDKIDTPQKEVAGPKKIATPKKKAVSILNSNVEGVETATQDKKGFYRTPDGKLATGYYTKKCKDGTTIGMNLQDGMFVKSTGFKKVGVRNKYNFTKTFIRQHEAENGLLLDRTIVTKLDNPKAQTGTRTVITHETAGNKKVRDIVSVFNVDFNSKTEHEIKRTVCTPEKILQYDATNGLQNCRVRRMQRDTKETAAFETFPDIRYTCADVKMQERQDGVLENAMSTFVFDDSYHAPIYTEACLNAIAGKGVGA